MGHWCIVCSGAHLGAPDVGGQGIAGAALDPTLPVLFMTVEQLLVDGLRRSLHI